MLGLLSGRIPDHSSSQVEFVFQFLLLNWGSQKKPPNLLHAPILHSAPAYFPSHLLDMMEMGRMAAIPGSWRRSCPQSLASLPAVPASSFTSWAPRPFPNSCPGTLKPFLCHSGIFRSLPDPSTALSSGKPPRPDELPLCKYISLCKKQAPNSDLCRVYFWTWIFFNFFFPLVRGCAARPEARQGNVYPKS